MPCDGGKKEGTNPQSIPPRLLQLLLDAIVEIPLTKNGKARRADAVD
jgi:hypothetical protein